MARVVPSTLLTVFIALWAAAAVHPLDRFDWLLENLLVFLTVPALVVTYRWFKLSDVSYALLFVFVSLHVIGSHWTYNHVPGFFWGDPANHANVYDRIVHTAYGLLLTYPAAEVFQRTGWGGRRRSALLAFQFVLATSALYEIMEWATAMIVAPGLADQFLGQQGDAFDAVADMAMAASGSAASLAGWGLVAWARRARRRHPVSAPSAPAP